MRIPIERLKELSKRYDLSHLILFVYHPTSNEHHIVTYGQTQEGCGQAADFGNKLKDALGWPESLHAQPSRVKKLQARIKELEDQIELQTATLKDIADIGETQEPGNYQEAVRYWKGRLQFRVNIAREALGLKEGEPVA